MKDDALVEQLLRGELILMEYLWKKDSLISKKQIINDMKQMYGWHKSTITTLLKRLLEKGFLAKDIIKFRSHYKIIIGNKEYYTFKKKVLKSKKNRKIIRSLSTSHKPISRERLNQLEEYFINLKEED